MADGEFLHEFVVAGRPVSSQTRWRDRVREWMVAVRAASLRREPARVPASSEPLSVRITHYFAEVDLDVDNIAKPVLDAVKGGVLRDDKQVYELVIRKREAASARRAAGLPIIVSDALASVPELVHVVVRALPSEDGPR